MHAGYQATALSEQIPNLKSGSLLPAKIRISQNLPRMTKSPTFSKALQKLTLAFAIFTFFFQCSEQEIVPASRDRIDVRRNVSDSTTTAADSSKFLIADCKDCTYVVRAGMKVIDGKVLGLKPGSIIGLNSSIAYGSLEFHNVIGTPENPIIIKNCGGVAKIVATDKWHAVKAENSKYFRITGGDAPGVYGIRVNGGEMGLKLDELSTNFEIDHVEVSHVSFAGVMAKSDPTCDDATIRGNFTMYDVLLHDNYVHDTGGEGFYIGSSFWDGMERSCGMRLPHEIKGLKVYNNIVKNTGWEAIQVGCAIEGTEIYNNTIENYGAANRQFQNNGIQIGSGTGGLLYNNLIKKGTGNGMIIMGTGDNVIYNNIIVAAGSNGVFCDERYTPGEGFKFINNTILSPAKDGIRLFAELVPMNTIVNNIIANPGTYGDYTGADSRTKEDAFVYLVNDDVNVKMSNNLFASTVAEIKFVDTLTDNYRLNANSPAINFGLDISRYSIEKDFYLEARIRGNAVDIGASEF